MATDNISTSIISFFKAIKDLKESKVVVSDRYLGDIGEYIAAKFYNVVLSDNLREETIDGMIGEQSAQIKFSGSKTRTNLDIGKCDEYDILILVLSQDSNHFPVDCKSDLVMYKILSSDLLKSIKKSEKNKFYITRDKLKGFDYDEVNYSNL